MVHTIKNNKIRKGKGIHKTGKHTLKDFKGSLEYFPDKNTEEWEKEVKEIYGRYAKGEINEEDAKKEADELVMYDLDEPSATIYYYNYPNVPIEESDEDEPYPHRIGHYSDETQGDFDAEWHSTDAWRGYYVVTSKDWVNVHSDCILSHSEDSRDLKDFDEKLCDKLNEKKIAHAKAFSMTSNVFSSSYDFFVQKKDAITVKNIVNDLLKVHRDPEKFTFTALTGTDPSRATPEDKVFVKSAEKLMAGVPMEQVLPEAIKEVKKMKKGEK